MNKIDIVSETTLVDNLERIKFILNKISAEEAQRIIFMNLKGLFKYITDMNYTDFDGKNNIKILFDAISPYIPVSITDENLAQALKASLTINAEEEQKIDESFINYSKIRFLNRISLANEEEWANIKSICLTIRNLMERTADSNYR